MLSCEKGITESMDVDELVKKVDNDEASQNLILKK